MKKKEAWSNWTLTGVAVRDARSERTQDDVPKHKPKKNYKRWCKGHEGKEHQAIWVKNKKSTFHFIYVCQKCKKVLDSCPSNGGKCKKHQMNHMLETT